MKENISWKPTYRIGSIAAMIAAVIFRRNIGAEVSLFTGFHSIVQTSADWFTLLQTNPFVGMSFLSFFDLFNYILVGVVFIALFGYFWEARRSIALPALAGGLVGIAASIGANISLTMMSLSRQYAAATSDAARQALLAAGDSVFATNNPLAYFPGTGTFVGFLLIAVAAFVFAALVFRDHRMTGALGLIAAACDLIYCATFAVAPTLQVLWMATGGAFWMLWHIAVAIFLWKAGRSKL